MFFGQGWRNRFWDILLPADSPVETDWWYYHLSVEDSSASWIFSWIRYCLGGTWRDIGMEWRIPGSVKRWPCHWMVLDLGFWGAYNGLHSWIPMLFQKNKEQKWTPSFPFFFAFQPFSTTAEKVFPHNGLNMFLRFIFWSACPQKVTLCGPGTTVDVISLDRLISEGSKCSLTDVLVQREMWTLPSRKMKATER